MSTTSPSDGGRIEAKDGKHDFHRLMDVATKLKCSELASAMI